jgi:predicted SAM-dependent methyltransferase
MTAARSTIHHCLRRGRRFGAEVVARLNQPLARWRLRRVARTPDLLVHVGAGTVRLSGWVNTDVDWRAAYYLDARKPWPITSAELIYADDVIEHFTLDEARSVFRHALVALRPNGRIRVVTPDVEGTVRLYLNRGSLADAHLSRHRQVGYRPAEHYVDLLRITFCEAGHAQGYLWDYSALQSELHDAGFVDVCRYQCSESDDARLRGLEQRTGPTVEATSLIVEARRP